MAKKRKQQDAAALEELEKSVLHNFTAAANSISQLYASAEAQMRITFHAGEQHGLEKIRQWIFARQEEGLPASEAEILTYLQNELGYASGDAPTPLFSRSNEIPSSDMQMLTLETSVQNLQMPQGAKLRKMFTFTSAPTSPVRGSPFVDTSQYGHRGGGNLQVPQIGNNQMPAGNCLPDAFAQLDHLNHEEALSDSLDSAMDMNIEEQPNQCFP